MMKSMAASTLSSSSICSLSHFTTIEEGNEEEEFSQGKSSFRGSPQSVFMEKAEESGGGYQHQPTPLHSENNTSEVSLKKRSDPVGVLCDKCRPSNREKISVVPLENNRLSSASPNGIFKSILGSLAMKKSPRSSDSGSVVSREDHWKIVVAELSNKLVYASRKRDEAILEASKLKHSMAELEKKLNKLEIYCHSLKSGLEAKTQSQNQQNKPPPRVNYAYIKVGDPRKVIQHFLILVSEARSSVRILSRTLVMQFRQAGGKVYDRISLLLQPYDIKISFSKNPRGSLLYLEALLNKALYEDFETTGFQKNSSNPVLNPLDHCEASFAMFTRLHELTWEEVLGKGTKNFSEEFSKFCDRKMNDIVAMLGWSRAWPEPLLQAFFRASKSIWLVHLLANSVHPSLPIFRVDKGAGFDPVYMEDMGRDRAKKLVPSMVRIMVTPGFYVYDNVVKCKVLCRYYNSAVCSSSSNSGGGGSESLTTTSPCEHQIPATEIESMNLS